MANYVTQCMIFTGDPTTVREVMKSIEGAPGTPNELFDLNQIILMPDVVRRTAELATPEVAAQVRTKADSDDLLKRLAAAQYASLCQTGHLTWHDWSLENWGTIYNVFAIAPIEGKSNELLFKSVEMPIVPALIALSKLFPLIKIELEYLHEAKRFIGRSFITNGKLEYRFYGWDDKEAQDLRARLEQGRQS